MSRDVEAEANVPHARQREEIGYGAPGTANNDPGYCRQLHGRGERLELWSPSARGPSQLRAWPQPPCHPHTLPCVSGRSDCPARGG